MNPDFLLNLLSALAPVAGLYAAIRADLVRAMMTAQQANSAAQEAHQRIDKHLEAHQ